MTGNVLGKMSFGTLTASTYAHMRLPRCKLSPSTDTPSTPHGGTPENCEYLPGAA
jgi:hypothetical protein